MWKLPPESRTLMMRKPLIILLLLNSFLSAPGHASEPQKASLKILCSTYPVYEIATRVLDRVRHVELDLLVPPEMGCPHHYTVTPQDMMKLSQADIFMINGLGMEASIMPHLQDLPSSLRIIDSTGNAQRVLFEVEKERRTVLKGGEEISKTVRHRIPNPHLFTHPLGRADMAMRMAMELAPHLPGEELLVRNNALKYGASMIAERARMRGHLESLKNRRVVATADVLEYLARELELEIVARIPDHHGEELSGAALIELVHEIKERDPYAILVESESPLDLARMLGQETGVRVVEIDVCETGPKEPTADRFGRTMRDNLMRLYPDGNYDSVSTVPPPPPGMGQSGPDSPPPGLTRPPPPPPEARR